jgi:putative transposase
MPQSLADLVVHLVFSTKNRVPFVREDQLPKLFTYLGGSLRDLDSDSLCIGGRPDHVHILFRLSRNHPISKIVEELKKQSSKWAKSAIRPEFYWQAGYGAFSVSSSNISAVKEYIQNQEEHHRKRTFQDEYRLLLEKHGLGWDERYVWD